MKPVKGWGWMLAGGIVSVLFALMIGRQFPTSAVWLVGVSLLFEGFTTLSVAGAARAVASEAEKA